MEFIIFTPFSPSNVERKSMTIFTDVTYEDLDRLKPGKWLNDSLVFSGLK
jgi:Ulp1 family protease